MNDRSVINVIPIMPLSNRKYNPLKSAYYKPKNKTQRSCETNVSQNQTNPYG